MRPEKLHHETANKILSKLIMILEKRFQQQKSLAKANNMCRVSTIDVLDQSKREKPQLRRRSTLFHHNKKLKKMTDHIGKKLLMGLGGFLENSQVKEAK